MKQGVLLKKGWLALLISSLLWVHPTAEKVHAEEEVQSCQLVVDPQTGKWSSAAPTSTYNDPETGEYDGDGAPYVAEADQSTDNPKIKACMDNAMDIRAKVMRLLSLASTLSVAVAFGMILYAGFLYLTSAGNPKQIDAAKKQLFYTAIGCFIIACAYMIVKLYVDAFGG